MTQQERDNLYEEFLHEVMLPLASSRNRCKGCPHNPEKKVSILFDKVFFMILKLTGKNENNNKMPTVSEEIKS